MPTHTKKKWLIMPNLTPNLQTQLDSSWRTTCTYNKLLLAKGKVTFVWIMSSRFVMGVWKVSWRYLDGVGKESNGYLGQNDRCKTLTLPPMGYRILWLPPKKTRKGYISHPMLIYSIFYLIYLGATCKKSARYLKIWARCQDFKKFWNVRFRITLANKKLT